MKYLFYLSHEPCKKFFKYELSELTFVGQGLTEQSGLEIGQLHFHFIASDWQWVATSLFAYAIGIDMYVGALQSTLILRFAQRERVCSRIMSSCVVSHINSGSRLCVRQRAMRERWTEHATSGQRIVMHRFIRYCRFMYNTEFDVIHGTLILIEITMTRNYNANLRVTGKDTKLCKNPVNYLRFVVSRI